MRSKQIWPVVAAGCVPAIVVGVTMFVGHNIFIAMFLMHWIGMVPAIVFFSWLYESGDDLRWYSRYIRSQEIKGNAIGCTTFVIVGFAIPVLSYMVLSCKTATWGMCIGSVTDNIAEYGFKEAPVWLLVICLLYFPIVNPFIEEMFWRVFMNHESEPQLDANITTEETSAICIESGVAYTEDSEALVKLQVPSLPLQLLYSCLFASYHTMVIGVFMGDIKFGIIAFFSITALGMVFEHLFAINSPTQGFYKAVALHVGIDLGVLISLGDSVGWYRIV